MERGGSPKVQWSALARREEGHWVAETTVTRMTVDGLYDLPLDFLEWQLAMPSQAVLRSQRGTFASLD